MIINSGNLVRKTDLRQNLASIMSRVISGDKIYVSDRGSIIAVISSLKASKEPSQHFETVVSQQKELRKLFLNSKLHTEDTTEFVRNERNKRSFR